MKKEEEKKVEGAATEEAKRNILRVEDRGDFSIEYRKVMRKGMKEEGRWELKLPKTLEAAERLYGSALILKAAIATLRTDGDDKVEKGLKPESEDAKLKADIRGASDEMKKKIAAMLAEDAKKK
jgi:hypothetical protein